MRYNFQYLLLYSYYYVVIHAKREDHKKKLRAGSLREGAHTNFFLSGRTNKRGGGMKPPEALRKKLIFSEIGRASRRERMSVLV